MIAKSSWFFYNTLIFNLASVAKKGGTAACNAIANLASKELTSVGTNVIAAKVSRSFTWFSSSCARRTTISQTAQKSLQNIEREILKGKATGSTNLATQSRTNHILFGDATGGGHLYPGINGKSFFPSSWDSNKIMHNISDIVTDPKNHWQQITEKRVLNLPETDCLCDIKPSVHEKE